MQTQVELRRCRFHFSVTRVAACGAAMHGAAAHFPRMPGWTGSNPGAAPAAAADICPNTRSNSRCRGRRKSTDPDHFSVWTGMAGCGYVYQNPDVDIALDWRGWPECLCRV